MGHVHRDEREGGMEGKGMDRVGRVGHVGWGERERERVWVGEVHRYYALSSINLLVISQNFLKVVFIVCTEYKNDWANCA